MKIATLKQAVRLCLKSKVTPVIWGHRGLGKSSIVSQITQEDKSGFIDMRCSQLEASDLRGLPDRKEGRTHYLPPADMPIGDLTNEQFEKMLNDVPEEDKYKLQISLQSRLKSGILFLDELNRAQDDVLQAVFQLVLDRRVGQYALPPEWGVVVAGNFMEGYMVNGFTDPAFLNRFCHLILSGGETTLDEWVGYMADSHGENSAQVIEFASQNLKHLDGDIEGDLGFSIQPSRRSWEMVVRVERSFAETGLFSDDAKTEVIAGLIGRELALSYTRYSCPVKPKDLITQGVEKMNERLKKLDRNQMTGLMWGLVGFIKPKIDDEKQSEVALDFAGWMCKNCKEKDLVVAFCKALVTGGSGANDQIKAAAISNPNVAKLLAKANSGKKRFIDRLNERPELQQLLSKTAWGE